MSLLESIRAGRQLRNVGGIQHDSSAPKTVDTLKLSDEYDSLVLQANIENWGSALAEAGFTPKTLMVPLSVEQGRLLLKAYEELDKDAKKAVVDNAREEYLASGLTSSPLLPDEARLLEELGGGIQRAIDELSDKADGEKGEGGCFVKLSSRSPKDAAARSGVFESYYARELRRIREDGEDLDEQRKLWILCESEGAALRFRDAASVVRALVLSERVWQDMTLALRHPENWQQNVILRKWEPVPIDMEFRTFVFEGKMTAISQYAYQLYSPRLNDPAQRESAVSAMKDLFAKLWLILSETFSGKCVLDFGVIPPNPSSKPDTPWRAILIEVNPFEETTDGALFSWTKERGILEGKKEDLEYPAVRVTETKRGGALAMVPKGWKEVVEKVESRTPL
ncbi:cell division cycle protein 123-like protein [Favolaschia claudopus]|uniref:Cell division cycle protein 123-like protein n=1 Tax=Favolaschia claudopus TaxID=2862362 RepID=A0AAW0D7S6_9AGAR